MGTGVHLPLCMSALTPALPPKKAALGELEITDPGRCCPALGILRGSAWGPATHGQCVLDWLQPEGVS